jgi:hypothetical protein
VEKHGFTRAFSTKRSRALAPCTNKFSVPGQEAGLGILAREARNLKFELRF